jgi:hypothetical protein
VIPRWDAWGMGGTTPVHVSLAHPRRVRGAESGVGDRGWGCRATGWMRHRERADDEFARIC